MPSACVLTKYGPPSVLEWAEVAMPDPSKGEIRIKAIVSGVGPTDLKIRRGSLAAVYPLPDRAVLGFETAGVVDAVGDGVWSKLLFECYARSRCRAGRRSCSSAPGDRSE